MIRYLSPYGQFIQYVLMWLAIFALSVAIVLSVVQLMSEPEARVLTGHEAMQRGWSSGFEE